MEFKSARINVLHISVEVITISVSIRQHEPILHGRQLGDYSPNQVASSKILGTMATTMVATSRVGDARYTKSIYALLSHSIV